MSRTGWVVGKKNICKETTSRLKDSLMKHVFKLKDGSDLGVYVYFQGLV